MLVKGKLIKCNRELKEFRGRKGEEKLYITLADVELSTEKLNTLKEVYKESGLNFTPDWIKNFKGYVNVSTKFELPFIAVSGEQCLSIEDAQAVGLKWLGADVVISLKVKNGAIYPVAIKMLTEGVEINPFYEFEN